MESPQTIVVNINAFGNYSGKHGWVLLINGQQPVVHVEDGTCEREPLFWDALDDLRQRLPGISGNGAKDIDLRAQSSDAPLLNDALDELPDYVFIGKNIKSTTRKVMWELFTSAANGVELVSKEDYFIDTSRIVIATVSSGRPKDADPERPVTSGWGFVLGYGEELTTEHDARIIAPSEHSLTNAFLSAERAIETAAATFPQMSDGAAAVLYLHDSYLVNKINGADRESTGLLARLARLRRKYTGLSVELAHTVDGNEYIIAAMNLARLGRAFRNGSGTPEEQYNADARHDAIFASLERAVDQRADRTAGAVEAGTAVEETAA